MARARSTSRSGIGEAAGAARDTGVGMHPLPHENTRYFKYEAYLRDIIGPGHGEDARDDLGVGPTAKDLRRAAEKRARVATGRRQP